MLFTELVKGDIRITPLLFWNIYGQCKNAASLLLELLNRVSFRGMINFFQAPDKNPVRNNILGSKGAN